MPFIRTLLIILAIYLAFKVGQILYRSHLRRNAMADKTEEKQLATTMVPCAICGLHLPKSEALSVNGRYACSEAHKQALSNRS